jgi:hypothetical protein
MKGYQELKGGLDPLSPKTVHESGSSPVLIGTKTLKELTILQAWGAQIKQSIQIVLFSGSGSIICSRHTAK